jgi:uracil-DNA glycosylase
MSVAVTRSAPPVPEPLAPARTEGVRGRGDPAGWDALTREIERCQRCPLHRTRNHVVVYRGGPAPWIVFVGEAPGAEEDRVGLPFQGRSGRWLDAAIRTLGLAPEDVGILNLIKCRPPENRFDARAARTCRPYLDRQLTLLAPERLVSLGAHALRSLDPTAPPILAVAGTARSSAWGPLFPLLHPAAALRSRRFADRWIADVAALGRWLNANLAQPV